MAANTLTCTTGAVTGSNPSFVVTQQSQNHGNGLCVYLDYTIGSTTSTSLSLTFDVAHESLGTSTLYRKVSLSGTAATALTYKFSATGKYCIPVPMYEKETTLAVNCTFETTDANGVAVLKILEY